MTAKMSITFNSNELEVRDQIMYQLTSEGWKVYKSTEKSKNKIVISATYYLMRNL